MFPVFSRRTGNVVFCTILVGVLGLLFDSFSYENNEKGCIYTIILETFCTFVVSDDSRGI